jgi:hypothetical protein
VDLSAARVAPYVAYPWGQRGVGVGRQHGRSKREAYVSGRWSALIGTLSRRGDFNRLTRCTPRRVAEFGDRGGEWQQAGRATETSAMRTYLMSSPLKKRWARVWMRWSSPPIGQKESFDVRKRKGKRHPSFVCEAATATPAPSGSTVRDRSSGVDRFEESPARVGPGPDFSEAVFHCLASRLERGVEFVAGVAFGDSQKNPGAFDRALVEMACHDCPANTQSRAGARLMSLEMSPEMSPAESFSVQDPRPARSEPDHAVLTAADWPSRLLKNSFPPRFDSR